MNIRNDGPSRSLENESGSYRLHVLLTKEEDGSYSALVLNLPGVGSCGEGEGEALENAREAFLGAAEAYKSSGAEIPWKDTKGMELPAGAEEKWILVDA